MKKTMLLAIALIMVVFLSACNNSVNANATNKENIVINVRNNTNLKINGLELNWYQSDDLKGTQGSINADGSEVGRGESLVFELLETDLNIKEEALFEVAILDNNDSRNKMIINNKVPLKMVGNAEYYFELSGSSKDNLTLKILE